MTATGHAVVGTVIAVAISNPVIGIPLAILSHIAADAFPHWDTGTNKKLKSNRDFVIQSFADLILSYILPFVLVLLLFPNVNLIYVYIMVIAAQGFDWASAPYVFLKIRKPAIFEWFYKLQKTFDNRLDKPWGIIGQVTVLIILVVLATRI